MKKQIIFLMFFLIIFSCNKNTNEQAIKNKLSNKEDENNEFKSEKVEENNFLDSISKLKIDKLWYRDYILLLESYEPNYNYTYYMKIANDSSYIAERSLKDMLIPYQNKDTLFLYHKKSLFEDNVKNKLQPEVKIVRIKNQYFVTSQLFDLENSISNKPTKYGFLVDEIN